jgi:hypothetical protein
MIEYHSHGPDPDKAVAGIEAQLRRIVAKQAAASGAG